MSTFWEGFADSFISRRQDDRDKKFRAEELQSSRDHDFALIDKRQEYDTRARAEAREEAAAERASQRAHELLKLKLEIKNTDKVGMGTAVSPEEDADVAFAMGYLDSVSGEEGPVGWIPDLKAKIVMNPSIATQIRKSYEFRKAEAGKRGIHISPDPLSWGDLTILGGGVEEFDFGTYGNLEGVFKAAEEGDLEAQALAEFYRDNPPERKGVYVTTRSDVPPTNEAAQREIATVANVVLQEALVNAENDLERTKIREWMEEYGKSHRADYEVHKRYGKQIADWLKEGNPAILETSIGQTLLMHGDTSATPEAPTDVTEAPTDVPKGLGTPETPSVPEAASEEAAKEKTPSVPSFKNYKELLKAFKDGKVTIGDDIILEGKAMTLQPENTFETAKEAQEAYNRGDLNPGDTYYIVGDPEAKVMK